MVVHATTALLRPSSASSTLQASTSPADLRTRRQGTAKKDKDNAAQLSQRIIKKRETDRLAQRANRQRTKLRIQVLEEEVERLKSSNQNAAMLELMRVVEDQRKENEELQGNLEKIRSIVNGGVLGGLGNGDVAAGGRITESLSTRDRQPSASHSLASSSAHDEAFADDVEAVLPLADPTESPRRLSNTTEHLMANPPSMESWFASDFATDLDPTFSSTLTSNFNLDSQSAFHSLRMPPFSYDPYRGVTFMPIAPDELKWDVSNDAFIRALGSSRTLLGPDRVDAHVPFRAILWGWHTIDPQEREHPIWLTLRSIDERVFGAWSSKTQKLALMYVTHTLLKYRMNPTPESLARVPTWLQSRPSQDRVQHPPVIDLLLWPGLRDRLVYTHPQYTATGEFSRHYCKYLHFHWPFPESDIYSFDPRTRCFEISKKFREHVFDLRNWTMGRKFLERYSEFRDDIGCTAPNRDKGDSC